MTMPRAITFDFHDTLASCPRWFELEVRSLPAEVLGRIAGQGIVRGSTPDREAVTATYRELRGEVIGHGIEVEAVAGVVETFRRLELEIDLRAIEVAVDGLMREAFAEATPMPGAVETVRTLHDAGFALGVVSSAVHPPFLEWTLGAFGVLPLFRTVVTSASAGYYKSRPEIYHRALADLGAVAGETCHVGDSPRWDHGMAKSLGMRTVLVTTKELDPHLADPAPDLHLSSLVGSAAAIQAIATMPAARPVP